MTATAGSANPGSGKSWVWPTIIIGMLSVHALACLVVVFIATSDPTHAVVPDYHSKAVAWDEQQTAQRDSDALGWSSEIDVSLAADLKGARTVRLSLHDQDGEPVTNATVTLSAYHHARANDVVDAELKEAAPGEYVARMDMRRAGLWTFSLLAARDGDTYQAKTAQQVGEKGWRP